MESRYKAKNYKLLNVADLIEFRDIIPKLIFDLPKNREDYIFDISPICGWIYFSNYSEVQVDSKRKVLPLGKEKIEQLVREFLLRAKKNLANENKRNPKFSIKNLFPESLSKPRITPIFNIENQTIDHWLVKFSIYLNGGLHLPNNKIPIIGSSLDVRVGNGGKIIGISSNWRPISLGQFASLIPPNSIKQKVDGIDTENNSEGHDHDGHFHGDSYASGEMYSSSMDDDTLISIYLSYNDNVCYFDKGESSHQNFYTPFYIKTQGHHSSFEPASKNSLVVNIIEDHYEGKVDLYAHVLGGSGKFNYEWASWRIETDEKNYKDHGPNNRITLDEGAFTVSLTVIDKKTQIIEQTRSLIYVNTPEIERKNHLIL